MINHIIRRNKPDYLLVERPHIDKEPDPDRYFWYALGFALALMVISFISNI